MKILSLQATLWLSLCSAGIVQGAYYEDMNISSSQTIAPNPLDAYGSHTVNNLNITGNATVVKLDTGDVIFDNNVTIDTGCSIVTSDKRWGSLTYVTTHEDPTLAVSKSITVGSGPNAGVASIYVPAGMATELFFQAMARNTQVLATENGAVVSTTEPYGTNNGGGFRIGSTNGGNLSNFTFIKGAFLRVFGTITGAVNFNNVNFNLNTYNKGDTSDQNYSENYNLTADGTKYTLDMSAILKYGGVNGDGIRFSGNITLTLSDQDYWLIRDNAEMLTVFFGYGGLVENHSIYAEDDFTINIQSVSGMQLGSYDSHTNFDASNYDYEDPNMDWKQHEADIKASKTFVWNLIPIPEPSSTTLSLLALAGLAARRRRV